MSCSHSPNHRAVGGLSESNNVQMDAVGPAVSLLSSVKIGHEVYFLHDGLVFSIADSDGTPTMIPGLRNVKELIKNGTAILARTENGSIYLINKESLHSEENIE